MRTYVKSTEKETELFTREDTERVLCTLINYCERRANTMKRSKKYYKLKMEFRDNNVTMTTNVELKSVDEEGEEGKNLKCLEFVRISGDYFL